MASFYGNIKNNSRASFIFDKIYSSRCNMNAALAAEDEKTGAKIGDGVFINRYVLIDYNFYSPEETEIQGFSGERNCFYNRYDPNTLIEHLVYGKHRQNDADEYGANYDGTVWMKIYVDNKERYIMVAELNAKAPTYELIAEAPSEQNGQPHFDLRYSDDLNYKYHAPKNWDFILNKYNPNEVYSDTATNAYYYYEQEDNDNATFEINHEYPYYNKAGFNSVIRYIAATATEGIYLNDVMSAELYPEDEFIEIKLTQDTYAPNKYYLATETSGIYVKSTDEYSSTATYYIPSQKKDSNIHKKDTKRLDINLPSVGNAVAELYDSLYGSTTSGYARPYTQEDLFGFLNIEPYNNIQATDPISMAWALDVLKKYISELRYLAHGDNIIGYTDSINGYAASTEYVPEAVRIHNNYYLLTDEQINALEDYNEATGFIIPVYRNNKSTGLQSDWTLNDEEAFGYIYNKPRVIDATSIQAIWAANASS